MPPPAAFAEGIGYFSESIAAKAASRYNAAIACINAEAEVEAFEDQALLAEIITQIADRDMALARQATAFAVRQQRTLFAPVQG